MGGDSHVRFDKKKLRVEKGIMRLRCRDTTDRFLSPKFGAKSSHISPRNVTAVCGIDCLACQDEFFVNNPLGVKEPNII
jgi:hypothetical protein